MLLTLLDKTYRWRLKKAVKRLTAREEKYKKIQARSRQIAEGITDLEAGIQEHTGEVLAQVTKLRRAAEDQLGKLDKQQQ